MLAGICNNSSKIVLDTMQPVKFKIRGTLVSYKQGITAVKSATNQSISSHKSILCEIPSEKLEIPDLNKTSLTCA